MHTHGESLRRIRESDANVYPREKGNSASTRCWIVDDGRSRTDRDRRSLQDQRGTTPLKNQEKRKRYIAQQGRSTGARRTEQIKSNENHRESLTRERFRWLSIIADNHFARCYRLCAPAEHECSEERTILWYTRSSGRTGQDEVRATQFRAQRIRE